MKVALVLDDSLDPVDGVQQYVKALGRQLAAWGHDVRYLVGESTGGTVPNLISLSRNVPVRFNGNKMRIPLPAARREINELFATERYDVVHVQAPYSPFLAGRVIAAAPPTTRVVATWHVAPTGGFVAVANRALALLNSRTLRRFDAHIAVSPVARAFARSAYGIDSVVIPNPVDLDAMRPPPTTPLPPVPALSGGDTPGKRPESAGTPTATEGARGSGAGGRRVVFLGRLVPRKGAAHLLDAVRYGETHSLLPAGTRVIIGGQGALRPALEKAAAKLTTPVEFVGFVAEEGKAALLASADVAVFPSTGGETFGISLTEAMAAGARVVLAGDNPGYRSTMNDNEDLLVDVRDPAAFAGRLRRALTDADFAERAHAWQLQHVRQFDVRDVTRRVLAVYEG